MARLTIRYRGGDVVTVETSNINFLADEPRQPANRLLYLDAELRRQVVQLAELVSFEVVVDGEAAGVDLLAGYPPLV